MFVKLNKNRGKFYLHMKILYIEIKFLYHAAMKNMSLTGIVFAFCAAFLWGTAGTAQSFAHDTASPYWIGALRLLFACLLYRIVLFVYKRRGESVAPQEPVLYWKLILAAGVCIALFNLGFFSGVKIMGIAVGSATIIGSAPVWAGIIQALILRKSPPAVWWVGTSCAIAGGFFMVMSKGASLDINPTGLFLCLGAGFCYALYTIVSKKLVSYASPIMITTHIFTTAALIALPAALLISGRPVVISTDWLIVMYLGAFTTVIAYLFYTYALRYITAATGVAIGLFEPVTAFILAIVIAGEQTNIIAGAGLCLILGGLWFVLRAEFSQSKTH